MLQNPCKTLGFKKNMVFKIPPGGGGKPYPASGLNVSIYSFLVQQFIGVKTGVDLTHYSIGYFLDYDIIFYF